jgi:hypothetical protein
MLFADRLTLDAPKRTKDGYLVVRARASRTGVYDYLASEPSIADALPEGHSFKPTDVVKVLRDERTVFDRSAAHSFIGKPITDDHPREAVTAANWRDHARGTVMNALRDGEFLAFDLMLTDAATIAKVDAGKAELSNGYGATLEFGDFTAPDGTKCHARQTSIAGNHVAIVDRGRAGPDCRVADAALCDSIPLPNLNDQEKPVKTMLIDGLTVDISNADTAEKTIATILAARDAATAKVTDAEAKVVAHEATIVAKDAEIAKLTADLAANKITPQQMRDAAKAYALIVGKAKASGVAVTDEMDEATIMKAVVDKAMPGNTYTADHVAIAFEALTRDVKVADATVHSIGAPVNVGDADRVATDAYAEMIADLKGETPAKKAA